MAVASVQVALETIAGAVAEARERAQVQAALDTAEQVGYTYTPSVRRTNLALPSGVTAWEAYYWRENGWCYVKLGHLAYTGTGRVSLGSLGTLMRPAGNGGADGTAWFPTVAARCYGSSNTPISPALPVVVSPDGELFIERVGPTTQDGQEVYVDAVVSWPGVKPWTVAKFKADHGATFFWRNDFRTAADLAKITKRRGFDRYEWLYGNPINPDIEQTKEYVEANVTLSEFGLRVQVTQNAAGEYLGGYASTALDTASHITGNFLVESLIYFPPEPNYLPTQWMLLPIEGNWHEFDGPEVEQDERGYYVATANRHKYTPEHDWLQVDRTYGASPVGWHKYGFARVGNTVHVFFDGLHSWSFDCTGMPDGPWYLVWSMGPIRTTGPGPAPASMYVRSVEVSHLA